MNAEVEIENAAIRNSDEDRVENSNSFQKSGAEDDIVNEEVDIEKQPLETQTKIELKTVIQFKRVGMNMIFGIPKLTFGIQKVEIQATQKGLKTAPPNPMKRMPTLQPKKKTLQPKRKTQKLKKLKMKTLKQYILQKKRAWL